MPNSKSIGGLSPNEVSLLRFLRDYITKNFFGPSYKEMTDHLELNSNSQVGKVLKSLEEQKLIERMPSRQRAIKITAAGRRIRLPKPE